MTDPISRTDLENAELDAATLAAVVNGGPSDTPVSRLGRVLRTLASLGVSDLNGYGINIWSPSVETADFTVDSSDLSLLHVVQPVLGQTLGITLPATTGIVGRAIAFMCPETTSGLCQFKVTGGQATSAIDDWASNTLFFWQGEVIVLLAQVDNWKVISFKRNPLFIEASVAGSDVALTSGVAKAINFATSWATTFGGTYLRHAIFGLDSSSPVNLVLPRRAPYLLEFDAYITFTGSAPDSIYGTNGIDTGVNDRVFGYAISATQWIVRYRRHMQNNGAQVVTPTIVYNGSSTSPIIAHATAPSKARLIELC